MAAPAGPAPAFSSMVRAAAREASIAAQKHINAVVASSMAQRSNFAGRHKATPGRQLVLVELDELGRPIARHLLPAPAHAPKHGCFLGPAPPPLRVTVGRASKRERDERRRRGAAAAAAAAAAASAPSSSSYAPTAPPPPIVTGAVSTLRVRLAHEGVSALQAVLLVGHKVQAPPTPASAPSTKAAKCAYMMSRTPISVCGVAGARHPTLLLRHGAVEEEDEDGGGENDDGENINNKNEAEKRKNEGGEEPRRKRRRRRRRKDGGEPPARVIGPGETAFLKLGDVVIFGGRAVVVEAEATASARTAGVPLSEAFRSARFGPAGKVSALPEPEKQRQKQQKAPLALEPPLPLARQQQQRGATGGGGSVFVAPPPPPPLPPKHPLSFRDDPTSAAAAAGGAAVLSGAAAAAALAAAAASRARQRKAAAAAATSRVAAATAATALVPPPPPPPPSSTSPPPLCVRLSASVAGDPHCASLAQRARLPLAAPGDLSSWTVFVVRSPGEQGGGFSRSLNWLLSLAGRRAVVSPAWLTEAARVVEEADRARAKKRRKGEEAEEEEEEEEGGGGEEKGSSRTKEGDSCSKEKPSPAAAAAAAAAAHRNFVPAPPAVPFALRDPASEARGKFTLDPELLCGWDDGRIPLLLPSSEEQEARRRRTGKRRAVPRGGGGAGEEAQPPPSRRPPRLCDGVTVAPSSALLACESDNGDMLCALIEASGGKLVRPLRTRSDGTVTAEEAARLHRAAASEREAAAAAKAAAAAEAAAAAKAAAAAGASAGAKTPGAAGPSSAAAAAAAATPLFAATPAAAAAAENVTPSPLLPVTSSRRAAVPPDRQQRQAEERKRTAGGEQQQQQQRRRRQEHEWLGLACSADSARERAWARENLPTGTRVLSRTAFVDAVIRQRLPPPDSRGVLFLAGE